MEIDCCVWNYILGGACAALFVCVLVQLVFLARRRKKKIKRKAANLKILQAIEDSRDLDILKEARKHAMPILPPSENILDQGQVVLHATDHSENIYETIKDKSTKMLIAVRDSVSIRMKQNISNAKGRNKIVTFSSDQFEVIPDTLEEVVSENISTSGPPLPPTNPLAPSESYYIEMGQKSSGQDGMSIKDSQSTDKHSQKVSHIYAKCKKKENLDSRNSIKIDKNKMAEISDENQVHDVTSSDLSKMAERVDCSDTNNAFNDCEDADNVCRYSNGDCEDELDEDELYNQQCEQQNQTLSKGMSDKKEEPLGDIPKLPKKENTISRVKVFGTSQDLPGVSTDNSFLVVSELYDIPPSRKPEAFQQNLIQDNSPQTPNCSRKVIQDNTQGSLITSTGRNCPETEPKPPRVSTKFNFLNRLTSKRKERSNSEVVENENENENENERLPSYFDPPTSFSSLVQNSFYAGSSPTMTRDHRKLEMRPSLTDINKVQERLNMIDSPDRCHGDVCIATPPILRRPSSSGISKEETKTS